MNTKPSYKANFDDWFVYGNLIHAAESLFNRVGEVENYFDPSQTSEVFPMGIYQVIAKIRKSLAKVNAAASFLETRISRSLDGELEKALMLGWHDCMYEPLGLGLTIPEKTERGEAASRRFGEKRDDGTKRRDAASPRERKTPRGDEAAGRRFSTQEENATWGRAMKLGMDMFAKINNSPLLQWLVALAIVAAFMAAHDLLQEVFR